MKIFGKSDDVELNQVSALKKFFAQRRERGDVEKALAFLSRKGGEAPRAGDEMPV